MEYTEIIYLIDEKIIEDDVGNILSSSISSKKKYAKKQSVRSNEFYNAVKVGITPTIEFVMKRFDYNSEQEVDWNHKRYSVIRTADPNNKFDIVLICTEKLGVNKDG